MVAFKLRLWRAVYYKLSPTDLDGEADAELINPPFAGRAWQDHFEHAAQFVREGGLVATILPSGARSKMPMFSGIQCQNPAYPNPFRL